MPTVRALIRTWVPLLLGGALLVVLLLFAGVYLFLSTSLGPRLINRHPERLRIEWDSARALSPGWVEVRGLRIHGAHRQIVWSVEVDQGRGRIRLADLLHRKFHVASFTGEGVRATVKRRPPPPDAAPRPPARRKRPGWTVEIENVVLHQIRSVSLYGTDIAGAGEAEGGFRFQLGGDFQLGASKARMTDARLSHRSREIARGVALQARATIAPYAVRQHPGLGAFDFTSGSLQATGRLAALGPRAAGKPPGSLQVDLVLERGRLQPGTRLEWDSPPSTGAGGGPRGPLQVIGVVQPAAQGPQLLLTAKADGFAIGGREGRPPLVESGPITLAASTPEVSLRELLGTARKLRTARTYTEGPLDGTLETTGLRLGSVSRHLGWNVTADRARGRIDLPALLDHRVVLGGIVAEGVTARLDLVHAAAPAPKRKASRWSVEVQDARLTGVREVAFGERRLTGDGTAQLALATAPGGVFELRQGTLAIPVGRYWSGKEMVTPDLDVRAEARIAAPAAGPHPPGAAGILRRVSGRLEIGGTVLSLGLLEQLLLQKAPWLRLDAHGRLQADLRMDAGRLAPGTRLSIRSGRLKAAILGSQATGTGTVTATVEAGPKRPHGMLAVGFDRFSVVPSSAKAGQVLVRGRDLRITTSSSALDLAGKPFSDMKAEVRLPAAEVPDLRVYNAYLPEGTGVSLLSGAGKADLLLTLDAVTQTASGKAGLTSKDLKIRIQDLELQGILALNAPLKSSDLRHHDFRFGGTRLDLKDVTYRETGAEAQPGEAPVGWWARLDLTDGTLTLGKPLSLRTSAHVRMKNADLILNIFSRRKRFLGWFKDLLRLENLEARGDLKVEKGAIVLAPVRVQGGRLDLRSRLRFSRQKKEGELFIRYGRLATAIELRDGKRTFHLRHPERWYEGNTGR